MRLTMLKHTREATAQFSRTLLALDKLGHGFLTARAFCVAFCQFNFKSDHRGLMVVFGAWSSYPGHAVR
jgi:hypothetical protein